MTQGLGPDLIRHRAMIQDHGLRVPRTTGEATGEAEQVGQVVRFFVRLSWLRCVNWLQSARFFVCQPFWRLVARFVQNPLNESNCADIEEIVFCLSKMWRAISILHSICKTNPDESLFVLVARVSTVPSALLRGRILAECYLGLAAGFVWCTGSDRFLPECAFLVLSSP